MRWGDPITTKVRGQGRLVGSKLAWIFQSRRRITIFVLIFAVVVSSASYGLVTLNNKNAFRAAEDPEIELPGLDYVEYTTQVIFSQKLALVPPEQLPFYDKIAITTELAGDLYFRISTVAERQDFLAAWDTSPEWRQFATQAESGEGGAWQWLALLEPYCDYGGGGVGKAPSLLPTAQAQSSNSCILQLAELQTKKIVNAGKPIGLVDFESDWSKFWQRALNTCSSDPGSTTYMKCLSTARFFKSYYNSPDLDRIYNTYWKDLKHLRTKKGFGLEEVARLKKIDKYFRLKLQNKMDEAIGGLGNLYFNIVLSAVPIERGVVWGIKGVSKFIGGAVDIAAKAPIGTMNRNFQVVVGRGAVQTARVAERFYTFSTGFFRGTRVSISELFKGSSMSSGLRDGQRQQVVSVMEKTYNKIIVDEEILGARDYAHDLSYTQANLADDIRTIIRSSDVVTANKSSKLYKTNKGLTLSNNVSGVKSNSLDINSRFLGNSRSYYNEIGMHESGVMVGGDLKKGYEFEVINNFVARLRSAKNGYDYSYSHFYSKRLGYNPIEAGATESTARYLAYKFKLYDLPITKLKYPKETEWFDDIITAIERGKKSHGYLKVNFNSCGVPVGVGTQTTSPRQCSMMYMFSNYGMYSTDSTRWGHTFDQFLSLGLPQGSKVTSPLKQSFIYFDNGEPEKAITLINSLFR